MHLRDGARGQGLGVEVREGGFRRRAQVLAELGVHLGPGAGGGVVLQLAEFGDPVGLELVHPSGQDLAELDEGRAEVFQRAAHALRRGHVGVGLGVVPVQGVAGLLQGIGQAHAPHQVAKAMADQHGRDGLQPAQVAHRAQGLPQHGASCRVRVFKALIARSARAFPRRR